MKPRFIWWKVEWRTQRGNTNLKSDRGRKEIKMGKRAINSCKPDIKFMWLQTLLSLFIYFMTHQETLGQHDPSLSSLDVFVSLLARNLILRCLGLREGFVLSYCKDNSFVYNSVVTRVKGRRRQEGLRSILWRHALNNGRTLRAWLAAKKGLLISPPDLILARVSEPTFKLKNNFPKAVLYGYFRRGVKKKSSESKTR